MPTTKTLLAATALAALSSFAMPAARGADAPQGPAAPDPARILDGGALYKQACAVCHDAPAGSNRAPAKAVLASRTPDQIAETLTKGAMKPMAQGLSRPEVEAIAIYLTGKAPTHATEAEADSDAAAACRSSAPLTPGVPRWNGWSPTLDNARYQPALGARDLARLKLKWAFKFPGGVAGQPVMAGSRVYFGSGSGRVYSLDARTGCIHWRADIKGGVRAAVSIGPLAGPSGGSGRLAVFVADRTAGVHALDAANGREIWAAKVETHPFATITGSPALYRGRLYVPVSSAEEISSLVKGYKCCSFRGHVTALDAGDGKMLWTTYAISDPPRPYRDDDGQERMGPAGAAIWSAPTIDARRGVLYVATGDSYTDAPNTGSDAVMSMDLVTGEVRWSRQITEHDNYLVACTGAKGQPAACPHTVGQDFDFGASPVLRELKDGRSVLMAGQKSGAVTALDPDRKGKLLWQTPIGMGGALGGVEWGMAADRERIFVPIADPYAPKAQAKRGMYALAIGDGRLLWSSPAPEPDCTTAPKGSLINICTSGLSAAPTAVDGAVIEGSMDGLLRAYDSRTGKVVWSVDVGQTSFHPLNAAQPMKGDTMNAAGATIAGGTLLQVAGYQTSNPNAQNLLLAYTVDGR